MKKIPPKFFLFFAIVVFALAFYQLKHHSGNKDEDGGEDIEGAIKWEQQRLADPSTGKIPDHIRRLELNFAATLPNDLQDRENHEHRLASASWQMRGPWNVGGRTRAFAADVNTEATLLAGTTSGGMWRSTDSGKTWALTTQLATEQIVSCVAQDTRANHTNVWYYGSGESIGQSASAPGGSGYLSGHGICRSLDNGVTWTSLASTTASNYWENIWNIATDPTAPDSLSTVYAALIYGSIMRSTDTGNTWTPVISNPNTADGYYSDVMVTSTGIVYAAISSSGSQRGIWRSSDGVHYHNILPSNFPPSYNRIVMCYAPLDPNQVYFLCNTPGYGTPDTNFQQKVEWNSLWKYKYLSGDGDSAGGIWVDLSANLPHTGDVLNKYNTQNSYNMVISVLPNDTATVFIGGTDIFRSTSGFYDGTHTALIGGYKLNGIPGATIVPQLYPGHHPDQHVLFFSPSNPYIMYSGCDGGVFKTLDDTATNVAWHTFDHGYVTAMLYAVTCNHAISGSPILIVGAQDNNCLFGNSLSLNTTWTRPVQGDGSICAIADSGKTFYFENTDAHLYKAHMDTVADTVLAFNRIDPIGAKNCEWINPYIVDPNNNNIMYFSGGKYLWRNNNLSAIPLSNMYDSISTNWVQWPDSVPATNEYITSIAVSTTPANIVYYGTSDRYIYRVVNANTGFSSPVNITPTSGLSAFPSNSYLTCIAVDPSNGGDLIAVFSNYNVHNLFYSSDSGSTWVRIGGNLNGTNQPSLRWAAIQHLQSGGTIYWVAASTGIYATDSLNGNSTIWVQQAASSIGNAVCDMIDVRQSDGLVAIATHARGVYTANITSLNDITTVHNINPENISMQVELYPNPSPGRASLSYYLPEEESAELRIYNQQGMLVRQMQLNSNKGNNIASIDISNQAAGVYFCSLITPHNVQTARMLVIK